MGILYYMGKNEALISYHPVIMYFTWNWTRTLWWACLLYIIIHLPLDAKEELRNGIPFDFQNQRKNDQNLDFPPAMEVKYNPTCFWKYLLNAK